MPRQRNSDNAVFAKLWSNYISASIALSFAGFLNGFDTGSIGAIVHMPQFTETLNKNSPLSPTLLGFTVSIILLTGFPPSLVVGHLADRRGRLRVIGPGVALFAIGAVAQAAATNLVTFIIGRAIAGIGQGFFLGNVGVYITEIAPSRRRGRLTSLPQFMATAGICLGYFCCFGTQGLKSSAAWRLPYAVPIACAVMLGLACLCLPESPRWLMLQGRAEEARVALALLDFDMEEARAFLTGVEQQPSLTVRQSYVMLFRRAYRPRTLLALFVLGMVQLSGIDAITYYAPVLFKQAGITSDSSSLISSGVASITMLIATIPGFLLADKWGRRTSVISGGLGLAGIMFLIGSLYAASLVGAQGAARWVVILCVFLFGIVYCATWGVVGRIYASEIQPGNTRGAANSLGMSLSYLTNFGVALVTPILLSASAYGAYFLFGGLALLTVAVLTVYMPETRGRSLESIQSEFRSPVSSLTSLLRRRGGTRQEAPGADQEIELQQRDTEGSAAVSSISVEHVGRGMRIDVAA